MNKKWLFFTWLFCVPAILFSAEKMFSLPDILKPRIMAVDENNLYVSDHEQVFIYSLNTSKLVKKFGRLGSGPGEFPFAPMMKIYPDKILLHFANKFAYFNKSGELIYEKQVPFLFMDVGAVDDNFVFSRFDFAGVSGPEDLSTISVYDQTLKKVNTLSEKIVSFKNKGTKKQRDLINPIRKFQCYSNKIYLADGEKGFHFDVYDSNGKSSGNIQREYKKIKISEAYKTQKFEEYKNRPAVKKRWHTLSKLFDYAFPEYFPAIQDFLIADNKIYVRTYLSEKGKDEYLILDLDGKLIKKVFLPEAHHLFYAVKNNTFYYMIENEEDEEWELHAQKIE